MTRQQSTERRSRNRFSVFDFDEHEEEEGAASVEILKKFEKRGRNSEFSPITKYQFLECFGRPSQTVVDEKKGESVDDYDGLTCVRHDGMEMPLCPESNMLINVNLGDMHVFPKTLDSSCKHRFENISCIKDISELGFSSNHEREHAGMTVEDLGQSDTCSTLVTTSISENGPLLELPTSGPFGHEIDCMNKAVICFPDFVLHGDIYCTEACLTFSCSGINTKGSSVNGARGTFHEEWSIDDIVIIGSEWCQHVETAMINIAFRKTKVSCGVGNQKNDFSDIDKLKFSVYDPYWNEAQEAIKLLDVRYKNMWNMTLEASGINYENFSSPNVALTPRPYFPVLVDNHAISTVGGTCIDVIYPKGDPDAVSINMRDLELLQPETFINDTIIDFYIQYLKKKIGTDGRRRFHFFNSFFFRKLADLDKDLSSAYEGKAAFERVRKWTRKLDLFGNDYIFIPVNYSLHWSLIIICHPGEVANLRGDEIDKLHKVPCILHLDSIKGSHRGLKNLFQSYLCEEWKARHIEMVNDLSSKFLDLRFVPLELPQQENCFDCGLFLLHYAECFLEEAPASFSPFKITRFSLFLNRNWFPPQEASLKRAKIQNLVYEILRDCSQEADADPAVVSSYHYPQFPVTIQPLYQQLTNTNHCQMIPNCDAKQTSDAEIMIPRSPISQVIMQQQKLNLSRKLELRTDAKLSFDGRLYHYRSCMSPIEENEESQEESDSLSSKEEEEKDCYQIGELAALSPTFSSPSEPGLVAAPHQVLVSRDETSMENSSSSGSSSTNGFQSSSEFGMVDEEEDALLFQETGEEVFSSTSTKDPTEGQRASKRPKLCFSEGYRMKI